MSPPVFGESIGGALIDSARISVMAAMLMLPEPPATIIVSGEEEKQPTLHGCLEQAMHWLDEARVQTVERGAPVTSLHVVQP